MYTGVVHEPAFALDANAKAPEFVEYKVGELLAGVEYDKSHVEEGTMLYVSNCVFCHGIPGVDRGGNIKNLGYSDTAVIQNLDTWLFNGPSTNLGMPDFTGKLTGDDVTKIQAFIQGTADAIRPAD